MIVEKLYCVVFVHSGVLFLTRVANRGYATRPARRRDRLCDNRTNSDNFEQFLYQRMYFTSEYAFFKILLQLLLTSSINY